MIDGSNDMVKLGPSGLLYKNLFLDAEELNYDSVI